MKAVQRYLLLKWWQLCDHYEPGKPTLIGWSRLASVLLALANSTSEERPGRDRLNRLVSVASGRRRNSLEVTTATNAAPRWPKLATSFKLT